MAARLSGAEPGRRPRVRRSQGGSWAVVGIDRDWPGRAWRPPGDLCGAGPAGHFELDAKQVALFGQYSRVQRAEWSHIPPQQAFDALSLSQQTTFDAVTHALMRSELTDEAGSPLGLPIDLLAGIDRIAGQVRGRGGDQQFRLYVRLKPTRATSSKRAASSSAITRTP